MENIKFLYLFGLFPLRNRRTAFLEAVLFSQAILFSCCTSYYQKPSEIRKKIFYREEALILLDNPPVEFKVRVYLAEKFKPQNCFGRPGSEHYGWKKLLQDNPTLVEYVKLKYRIQDDYYIFQKLDQLLRVKLINNGYFFEFNFVDGRCCTITKNTGIVYVKGIEIIECVLMEKIITYTNC